MSFPSCCKHGFIVHDCIFWCEQEPIVEPQGKHDFLQAMVEFYDKVKDPRLHGAVFLAVCRGKVSEGLDFTDANGRAVIITGLPNPPARDPKVGPIAVPV